MIRKLLAGGIVLVLLAGVASFVYRPSPGETISVTVAAGATTKDVAEKLASSGVISSVFYFRVMSKVRGLDGRIEAGRYDLAEAMGVLAALDRLAQGPQRVESISLTVPEGFTVRQIARRVGEKTPVGAEAFLTAANSVRGPDQPSEVGNPEGYLFPDTYQLHKDADATSIAQRMVDEFVQKTSTLDWSISQSKGLTRYQVLILASLVEREAKLDEDRDKVAAVIYNRLKKRIRLQIDITALYDAPTHKIPTRKDLRRESAYNTYQNDGLPPTPIASPGLESIKAALNPADIDAIYYVLIDRNGKHGFASTAAEFERLRRLCPPKSCARRS